MRFVAEAAAVSVNAARDGPEHVLARSLKAGFVVGACVGVLGGLIGLGGAEFRLPLLIGLFGFLALQAVILNKAMSLVVVATALPARLLGVRLDAGHPRPATSDPTKGALRSLSWKSAQRRVDDEAGAAEVDEGDEGLGAVEAEGAV
jgi:hypothetical protein